MILEKNGEVRLSADGNIARFIAYQSGSSSSSHQLGVILDDINISNYHSIIIEMENSAECYIGFTDDKTFNQDVNINQTNIYTGGLYVLISKYTTTKRYFQFGTKLYGSGAFSSTIRKIFLI